MKCCPTCGQTLPDEMPLALFLRGQHARIVTLLLAAGENGLPTDVLFDRLHGHDPNGGPTTGMKSLHVTISQLNKRHLREHGWIVKATCRGRGGSANYVLEKINTWSHVL